MKPFFYHVNNVIIMTAIISLGAASFVAGGYEKYQEIEIANKDRVINILMSKSLRELTMIDCRRLEL